MILLLANERRAAAALTLSSWISLSPLDSASFQEFVDPRFFVEIPRKGGSVEIVYIYIYISGSHLTIFTDS